MKRFDKWKLKLGKYQSIEVKKNIQWYKVEREMGYNMKGFLTKNDLYSASGFDRNIK